MLLSVCTGTSSFAGEPTALAEAVLRRLLQRDPAARPTARQLQADPFFFAEPPEGGGQPAGRGPPLFEWAGLLAKEVAPPFVPNSKRWIKNFSPDHTRQKVQPHTDPGSLLCHASNMDCAAAWPWP